jgi:DNA-binding response OmpR family regulator
MKKVILIVEDEEDLIDIYKEMFKTLPDYNCTYCTDSGKAMSFIRNFKIDAVITDYNMAGFDGLELCKMAKLLHACKTVMITGVIVEKETDVDLWIDKPMNLEITWKLIKNLLGEI